MARKRKEPSIADELLDKLLDGEDAQAAFQSGDLVQDLKRALAERILNAEVDDHLDGEMDPGNHRNGHSCRQVLTDDGYPVSFSIRQRHVEPVDADRRADYR